MSANSHGASQSCDRYNFRIQKLNSEGLVETVWLADGSRDDSKQYVLGIAVDSDGSIFVTDHYQHRVHKYQRSDGWSDKATDVRARGKMRK